MSLTRTKSQTLLFSQNDILTLKKKMRHTEAEFNKEKALMKQKIELLNNEIQNLQEREVSQKQMYDAMISALKSREEDPEEIQKCIDKQIEQAEKINAERIQNMQDQYKNKQINFEKQINGLQLENDSLNK